MTRPHFEPQPDNTFRIVHPGIYHSSSVLMRKIGAEELLPADTKVQLAEILKNIRGTLRRLSGCRNAMRKRDNSKRRAMCVSVLVSD